MTVYDYPTVDELLAGGLPQRQVPQFAAAAEIRFDGVRYGAIRPQRFGKFTFEFRFDKRSLEVAILAHAFAAAGIVDADLQRDEAPDFRCSLARGQSFGVEVAQLQSPGQAAYVNNVATIRAGANDAVWFDARRASLMEGVHANIRIELTPTAASARKMRTELLAWVDTELPQCTDGNVTFDRYPTLAAHRATGRIMRGKGRSLGVLVVGRWYDRESLATVALRIIERKRHKTYSVPTPWLVLGGTDHLRDFRPSLSTLWHARNEIDIAPFTRVIIQNDGDVVILGEKARCSFAEDAGA